MFRSAKNTFIWPLWRALTSSLQLKGGGTHAIVVLGMPRSGTSLVSRLVEACGVYFGEKRWMRPFDERNPDGFLELVEMNRLDDRLIYESGFSNHLVAEEWYGLRALPMRRLSRISTLLRMQKLLSKIEGGAKEKYWAFKQTPFTYYWWKMYTPKARIVGIYRDPYSCAESIHRTFKRFTFEQALSWWTRGNRELLFHLSQTESILVKFEDLLSKETRVQTLNNIATFCGGDISALEKLLDTEEKRDRKPKQTPVSMSPLPEDTRVVFEALEKRARMHS